MFQTTRTTLQASALEPYSFLSRFIDYESSSHRDSSGRFFIDRCGERFRTILNYLRSGSIHCTNDAAELRALAEEAEFYCLDRLAKIVGRELDRIALENQLTEMQYVCDCAKSNLANSAYKNIDLKLPHSPVDVKTASSNSRDSEFRLDADF